MDDISLSEIQTEEEALDQSIALNRITLSLLKSQKESNKRMFILLLVSLVLNVLMLFGVLIYESQWETVEYEVEHTVTTQEASGENAEINNVNGNQYNDNSVHNEGAGN